jgi:hypothetical protein
MFTLLRSISGRALWQEQLPSFLLSFVVAEAFYKFHSFTLETGAFLLTWFVLDAAIQATKRLLRGPAPATATHDR